MCTNITEMIRYIVCFQFKQPSKYPHLMTEYAHIMPKPQIVVCVPYEIETAHRDWAYTFFALVREARAKLMKDFNINILPDNDIWVDSVERVNDYKFIELTGNQLK